LTVLLLAACVVVACSRAAADVRVTWNIDPSPPVRGTVTVVHFTLQDQGGHPVSGARLRLEAHMAHPGMAPVTGEVVERGAGGYEARIQLSMAGDWIFVLTGQLADGSRVTREFAVPGVRSPVPAVTR
jgi:hypothetical protein